MDTRFLESLISVVEEGSIASAARSQMITPAAVSQRIQALEAEFKCKLFSRAGSTVQPTDACLALLPKVKRLLQDVRILVDSVQDSGLSGTLRVGANSTSLTAFIPGALKSIRLAAPNATFQVIPGNSIDLYRDLQEGLLDAAIMVEPPTSLPKSLRSLPLRTEPLVLIHHPKYKGSPMSILQASPYIRYDPTCWGGQIAEKYMIHNRIKKAPIFDLDSLEAIAQLVSEDVGVSFVPMWAGLEHFSNKISITQVDNDQHNTEIVLVSAFHPRQPKLLGLFYEHLLKLESVNAA